LTYFVGYLKVRLSVDFMFIFVGGCVLLISKVVSQLLLPPGGLIVLAGVGLVFWQRLWGRGLVMLALVLLWALGCEPVRDVLIKPLEFKHAVLDFKHLQAGINRDNTVIVLLGGGVHEKTPEYAGQDALRRYAMLRTVYAADIALKTGLDVYATGGTPLSVKHEPEGDVMKRWLIHFGVPKGQVFSETAANTTWENAEYTEQMLRKKGIKQVILVTSAWHMPRSVWCFEQHHLQVITAPTDFLSEQGDYDLRSYVPRWAVFADSGEALHEYLGMFWYHLRYAKKE